jgi:hypothetical protein
MLDAMSPTPALLLVDVAAFIAAVITAARLTRLIVHDAWPPTRAFRRWVKAHTSADGWQPLVTCPFCLSPWFALTDLLWGYAAGVGSSTSTLLPDAAEVSWWLVNLWLAVAYLASMLVLRDEPPIDPLASEDDDDD